MDELTPTVQPSSWPGAAVAIVRILATNATAVLLARWGLIPGEVAAGAAGLGLLAGVTRLLRRAPLGGGPRSDGSHLLPPGPPAPR